MNRALAWTVGGFAVLIAGILAALWIGTAPPDADGPSAATAVASAPPTPAPHHTPAAPPGADGGTSAAIRPGPALPHPGAQPPAGAAPGQPAPRAEGTATHDQIVREHRSWVEQRSRERRERAERQRAEHRQRVAAKQAMRAPDPDRPPAELPDLRLGPAIIPARGASSQP